MHEPSLINPLEEENWNNLLISTPGCSFFHTSNWADVLSRSYDYKPVYLCVKEENLLAGIFPLMEVNSYLTGKNGVCLPFSDMCEPIAQNTQQFQNLFEHAVVLGKKQKWKYLDIRGGEKYLSAEKPSQIILSHMLDLSPGSKKLFSNLRDSTRRNIKKAQKRDVKVNISNSLAAVKEFYRLNAMTRKRHGLPPQPFIFFKNLYDQVFSQNMGFISIASIKNKAIAANLYFNFGEEVIFKYGASDQRWYHLRPNNLVMWESINWSYEKGFKRLCFGRTEPEHVGLVQYKAGWGAKPYQINYYRYHLQKNCFTSNSSEINPFFTKLFSKLPIPVLKIIGIIFYRHMG